MMPRLDRLEFRREFQHSTGDTIEYLVMARIVDTPAYRLRQLGLEFPPGQDSLWGLLVFGCKDLHFFVHASESPAAAIFRKATNGPQPRQQYLHIPRQSLLRLEPVQEHGLIFRKRPRLLLLQFLPNTIPADCPEISPIVEGMEPVSLLLEPLQGLKEILGQLERYQTPST